jgi:hypothetical protein
MNCDKLATPVIFVDSAPVVRGERPAQWYSIGLLRNCWGFGKTEGGAGGL